MSDEGERTCPLCAEEMDLTDQQLRPCKCGYQICVWCWHHIMDMAEKDETEGRCPACRSPYDKEKIVGMAANCERLVAEVHMERKMKSQKAKSKSSDGRKQLSNVRVIRRNLVYIVGLPLDLADEDLLQRREYFGQYGKVLKVSMSRTAAGVVQQFPNNTCSVYITYSKEEEAIRCIQNVHGFVLEDRPLRACFGTTKYCHAWLRNMPCSNPDCVYLHEIGSQEDSFTKDEVVSAYTRSHIQQITGAVTNMERRSGNVLPPPLDDCTSNTSGKPTVKNSSSNSVGTARGLPPNGIPAKPMAPHAAWGLRATNCQPAAGGPTGLSKPKPDSISSTLPFSSAVAGTVQVSLQSDTMKRPLSSDGRHSIMPGAKNNCVDVLANVGEKTLASDVSSAPVNLNTQLSLARDSCRGCCTTSNTTKSIDVTTNSIGSFSRSEAITATNEEIQNLSSEVSSIDLDRNAQNEHYNITKPSSPAPDDALVKSMQSQGSEYNVDKYRDEIITNADSKASISDNKVCNSKEQYDLKLDSQSEVASGYVELEDDVTSFDSQRLKDPEVVCNSYLPNSSFPRVASHNNPHPLSHGEPCNVVNAGSLATDNEVGFQPLLHGSKALCNGYSEKFDSTSSYRLLRDERNDHHIGRLISEAVNIGGDAATDKGESSIISNILSMEFDAWNDSVLSPHNLAKLLSESTENQNGTLKKSNSCVQTNQSRFSFARQEESKIQAFDVNPSHGANQQFLKSGSLIQDFVETDKIGIANGFPATNNFEESENISGQFAASFNKISAVPKTQISAPPGFSAPSRPPPPGFSSHERMGQAFDSTSGNSLLDPSFLWRNSYQTPSTGNFGGAGDIEFMDPAILAVGKGRLQGSLNSPMLDMQSNYSPQLNYFENEARLQLLMQRSLSPQQNHRFSEIGNTFSHLGDSYGISSRIDQSQVSNLASFPQLALQQSRNAVLSNGNWDGWNEMQNGNSMGMAELLRNERLGFSKFHRGYDDSKYQMPNSGDLYNRTFGI
ncbi:uncharacterized protein [Medicago truncatula]|uniref:RNA-binding (RRM/RBD/RNP motif) family protein n=1 Tax=Medicago truncatula TaxID=3880 RepID=G7IU41_MEDTR|nr:uncharacterized protein LOC11417361 isoform X2 [Medicago truncatula]AES67391.1 RNA-binding (RRM/RBD/RNP motif) family protein [Medicago truncatula]